MCGECIAASNVALLDALGIGDAFAERAGAELRRVALMRGGETIVARLPAGEAAHPWGRALGREHLDTLLADAAEAAGATAAAAVVAAGDRRRRRPLLAARAAGGIGAARADVELRAGLVVAAHGSWEPLRSERAEQRESRAASDLFAFKANFRAAALDADLLPVLSFAGGYGGMVVADDGLLTLAGCIRADRLQTLRAAMPGARAGDAFESMLRAECTGVGGALAGATRDGAWLASGPLRPGMRVAADDGLFRVGNAAGEAHPIVGEGISMALQSAFLLAALIGPERRALLAPASALAAQRNAQRAYAALWRRRFARRLAVAAGFAHIAMRPALAGAAWPLVRRWPGVLTAGAHLSGKTRCVSGSGARGPPPARGHEGRGPRRSAAPQPAPASGRGPRGRFDRLDALRGFAIVWMAAFHFGFDLNYFRFIQQDFYRDPFWTVQRACIVTLFMACVGAGQAIASAQQQSLAALLAALGADRGLRGPRLARVVAHVPAQLHQLRRAARHRRDADRRSLHDVVGCVALAARAASRSSCRSSSPIPFFDTRWTNWVGLVTRLPVTEDFAPILPWLGVVWWGAAAADWLLAHRPALLRGALPRALHPLAVLGRWSLSFYMLHQPVLIGILWLVATIGR